MNRLIVLGVIVLALVAAAGSCLFVVDQRQTAVVFALGEIRRVITEPGLHFKLPPPFQNVQYFDRRTLTMDDADIDRFITSEKINIQVDSFVKWRIVDARLFFVSLGGSELLAQDRIARQLRSALNNEIARMTVAQVIRTDRDALVVKVSQEVAEELIKVGVQIVDVRLKRVDFAPEVAERVYDRMQSERRRVANERRATGTADSEKIRADADRQREVMIATAYRDAQAQRGQGDAEASRLFAEAFGKDPEFAAFYRSLEAYRASFNSRGDLLVLDPQADFFRFFRRADGAVAN
ncbi:MAG: protease modulator HflC [Burkholderiaceae bacterium]|nr:protease modulator HflC [Burkholderiaceae bacterium]